MAGPELALTPDLLEFAAAAESAISASALIIQLLVAAINADVEVIHVCT